jgi:hypothetical protein
VSRNRPAQISGKEDARLRVMNFMRLSIVGRSHVATPNDRFRGASLPNSTTAGGVAPVVPRTGTKRQISTTSEPAGAFRAGQRNTPNRNAKGAPARARTAIGGAD